MIGVLAGPAVGQSLPWRGLGSPGASLIDSLVAWDPDGAGPAPQKLVAAGVFDQIRSGDSSVYYINSGFRGVGVWNGPPTWDDLGFSEATCACTWDPDGDGPQPSLLIAGGTVGRTGVVRAWDGTAWRQLGGAFTYFADAASYGDVKIAKLTTWDVDGAGPLPARLVAIGTFQYVDGEARRGIALWDGNRWSAVGAGFTVGVSGSPMDATQWDPDGAGPLAPTLVVTGIFVPPTGHYQTVSYWDGAAWSLLGNRTTYSYALQAWDPDGRGVLPQILVVAGRGDSSNPAIARWNGSTWVAMGSSTAGVLDLHVFDPDGSGPGVGQLMYAAGNVGVWNGSQWQVESAGAQATRLVTWKEGPGPAHVMSASGQLENGLVSYTVGMGQRDGAAWTRTTSELGTPSTLGTWVDGSGAPRLIAYGNLLGNDQYPYEYVRTAEWDGVAWRKMAQGMFDGEMRAVTTWDPDGAGPIASSAVVAGSFVWVGNTTAGGLNVNGIALWDGSVWSSLGSGCNGVVNSVASWDPDGQGPLPRQLIAGGTFSRAGDVEVDYAAAWDGTAWGAMGWGLDGVVNSVATWRSDTGANVLIAGGEFQTAGADATGVVPVDHAAAWDGEQWSALGWGLDGPVASVVTWDPDGPGPLRESVVVAGAFIHGGADGTGEVLTGPIARWDGTAWLGVGPLSSFDGAPIEALSLVVWNDGRSAVDRLRATYRYWSPAIPPEIPEHWTYEFAEWDGNTWRPVMYISEAQARPGSFCAWDADGAGPGRDAMLWAGQARAVLIEPVVKTPVISGPWGSTSVDPGHSAFFWLTPAEAGYSYQWERETSFGSGSFAALTGINPSPEPIPSVSLGPTTKSLQIARVNAFDAGRYRCRVSNAAGTAISDVVQLVVVGACGTADFNNDGDTGTDADIEAFFACLAGSCCQTCGSVDFNSDGDLGTDADIEAFFRILAGGPC